MMDTDIQISEDRRTIKVAGVTYDAAAVETVINRLAHARSQMYPQRATRQPPQDGETVGAVDPFWQVAFSPAFPHHVVVSFCHPSFGWLPHFLPEPDAMSLRDGIVQVLQRNRPATLN